MTKVVGMALPSTVQKGSGWRKLDGKHGPHAVQGTKERSGQSRADARPWHREHGAQEPPLTWQGPDGREAHRSRTRKASEAQGGEGVPRATEGPQGRREDDRGLEGGLGMDGLHVRGEELLSR